MTPLITLGWEVVVVGGVELPPLTGMWVPDQRWVGGSRLSSRLNRLRSDGPLVASAEGQTHGRHGVR